MANCSKCVRKYSIEIGEVAVEFNCPYGVSTVDIEEYYKDFDDEECDFFELQ